MSTAPSGPLSPAAIAAKLQQAIASHQRGVLDAAEQIYRHILQQQPQHFDALQLLGLIASQRGQYSEAVRLIGQALAIKPDHAPAQYNLGVALQATGRLEEALAHFDKAVALRPLYAEAWLFRGNTQHSLQRRQEALISYDRAVAANQSYGEAFNNRSVVLLDLERADEALDSADRALAIDGNNAAAFYNRGNALRILERFDEALAAYDRALALAPQYPEALTNRGIVLVQLRRFEEALESYDRALKLNAASVDAQYNRGNALRELKRLDEALAGYDRALALDPNNFEALTSRAHTLMEMRQFDQARENYGQAVATNALSASAHLNAGICHVLSGDFLRAWPELDWRWETEPLMNAKRDFGKPQWLGEDVSGKTVFLYAEQGLGDTIQFCRYAPLAAARGARVILEVQAPLKNLMTTLSGVSELVVHGDPLPPFDYHCPLMSLPRAFQTTLSTVPAEVPYLKTDPAKVAEWRARLSAKRGLRIGLAWSGNPQLKNDLNRSIPVSSYAPLAGLDVGLFGVQKDVRPEDAEWLAMQSRIVPLGPELKDFTDTAALVSLMDMVITVDTSIAHLAGALGKKVWILLPEVSVDWRWMLDRTDSPWYPTARLFRQPTAGDWDSVIADIARELSP